MKKLLVLTVAVASSAPWLMAKTTAEVPPVTTAVFPETAT